MMGMTVFAAGLLMIWLLRARALVLLPPQTGTRLWSDSTTSGSRKSRVRVPDPELLEEIGLSLYERKALVTLMVFGVADAASICREGAIPTDRKSTRLNSS